MTVFLDTAVLMYAAGSDHRLKQPCAAILTSIAEGRLSAVISTEVIQEIAHRFVHIRKPGSAIQLITHALELFSPVVPVGQPVVARLPGLIARYRDLQARDLIHVATCLEERIEAIVSPDRAFDVVVELRRIDPTDGAALAELHG